jgi:glutathione S-transferase
MDFLWAHTPAHLASTDAASEGIARRQQRMDCSVMKLYWSSRSPFVRKVMVTAHELGVAPQITTERVVVSAIKPNTDVMVHNPLAKLPTLILDDGTALYDSRVICEYLASLKTQPRLFPASGEDRWAALRQQARADGLMDTLILWLMERAKAAELQQTTLIEGCRMKLRAVLDAMEKDAGALERQAFGIGHIATGVALSYVDFRFAAETWREGRPKLAAWQTTFAKRPSMTATEHADVY